MSSFISQRILDFQYNSEAMALVTYFDPKTHESRHMDFDEWCLLVRWKQPYRWKLVWPSSAEWRTWDRIRDYASDNWPVRYFFQQSVPGFFCHHWHSVTRATYWLRCKLFRRYRWLYMPTLPVTWVDVVEKIPHAVFTLVASFVEKENGGRLNFKTSLDGMKDDMERAKVNPEHEGEAEMLAGQVAWMQTALEIYDYWQTRKTTVGVGDRILDWDQEQVLLKQEEEMLIKAIKIRGALWT